MGFAILNEKIIGSNEKISCHGSFQFGKKLFRDWKKGGHGPVDFTQSLAQSCDVYYYINGHKLGIERIARYARMFGLGSPTGFAAAEKGGLVPSDAWKRRRFKEKWYAGETISVAIGQGFNLVTPLQAANLIATVANGGYLWKPYVVKKVLRTDGRPLFEAKPQLIRKIPISQEIFQKIREGLKEVVPRQAGHGEKSAGAGNLRRRQDGHRPDGRPEIYGPQKKAGRIAAKIQGSWLVRRIRSLRESHHRYRHSGRKCRQAGVVFRPIRQRTDVLLSRENRATDSGLGRGGSGKNGPRKHPDAWRAQMKGIVPSQSSPFRRAVSQLDWLLVSPRFCSA